MTESQFELDRLRATLASQTEATNRANRELHELAREARHALLAAAGYIGGISLLDRPGIERTIREALAHPAIRAIGQSNSLGPDVDI